MKPAMKFLLLAVLFSATAHAEDLMDRQETTQQARRKQRKQQGNKEARLKQFAERAIKVKVSFTTTYYRGSSSTTRSVDVRDGQDRGYDGDELADLTEDASMKSSLTKEARRILLQRVGCGARLGICVAGPPVFALAACAVGAGAGAVLDLASFSSGKPSALGVTGALGGMVVGALVGLAVGFGSLFVTGFVESLITPALYYFLPYVPDQHFFLLAHQHNTALARELDLDPQELDPRFFPLRPAADTKVGETAKEKDKAPEE